MRADRLTRLADFLESDVKDDVFDMGTWGRETPCGTVACAFGWAAHIPEFERAGLKKRSYRSLTTGVEHFDIYFGPVCGILAASDFFEISVEQACYLFNDMEYPDSDTCTPVHVVVERIREFVKNEGRLTNA